MSLISVILPAYNEKDNIAPAVKALTEVFSGTDVDHELIFVSDGSVDGTYQEILKEAENDPHVRGAEVSRA